MQLNITTDYAIRLLLCLGEMDVKKPGPVIAQEVCIPPKYILKITARLREAGMIGSVSGSQGGYHLLKPLDQITWLEVVSTMENVTRINRCLEADAYCSRNTVRACSMRRFYQGMQKEIEARWGSMTLAQILEIYGDDKENGKIEKIEEIESLCRKQ